MHLRLVSSRVGCVLVSLIIAYGTPVFAGTRTVAMPFVVLEASPLGELPPDSVWVRAVEDSSLVRTVVIPDSLSVSLDAGRQSVSDSLPQVLPPHSSDKDRVADSLMLSRDSILRSKQRSDSLLLSSKDSLALVENALFSLIERGNDYRERYYFDKASECFSSALQLCPDEDLRAELVRERDCCDYASAHVRQVPKVKVVARAIFGADDFYLYYPMEDGSWRPVDDAPALYYPKADSVVVIGRNGEYDVIYPMYYSDRMYFASKELPGFGGYDIFYRDWDVALGEWGEPQNLGFPYNSPYDDFLFITTEDGKYDIFSSTRGLDADGEEVWVFVLEHNSAPTYVEVSGPKELERRAELIVPFDMGFDIKALDNADSLRSGISATIVEGNFKFERHTSGPRIKVIYTDE